MTEWENEELFQHHAVLYIKYIEIYKKLEECYDQMVHPQKRIFIKKILESTMIRICETKKSMIKEQPRTNSLYVHLDSLLFDLKYDPTVIELPVPRYFKEDDRINIDLVFKEKVKRDGDKAPKKKKGKKKKKKGKKKKKDSDDEDKEKEEEKDPPKELMIDEEGEKTFGTKEAVYEIGYSFMQQQMEPDFIGAIRMIQKQERGR